MLSRVLSHSKAFSSRVYSRFASTLVVGEYTGDSLSNSTLSAITAAKKIGGDVTVLIAGSGVGEAANDAAVVSGVSTVIAYEDSALRNQVAENVTKVVLELQARNNYSHIAFVSSNAGKNSMPRVAAKLDVAPLTDITAVLSEDTFERPTYAGNAISRVQSTDKVKVFTVRATAFEKASTTGGSAARVSMAGNNDAYLTSCLSEEMIKSERPDLTAASVVVSGGRALKSAENFQLLYTLADKMGAAVGASRAAVDAGYVTNDLQVGQTGKCVAPNLYIAVGISGAIQHMAGMKDSKTIVAINKDSEAPIMQVADYGLVEDLFKAVPEMTAKVGH